MLVASSSWDLEKPLNPQKKTDARVEALLGEFERSDCFKTGPKIYFAHTSSEHVPEALYWCAIESAARVHPALPVCVFSNSYRQDLGKLMRVKNVIIVRALGGDIFAEAYHGTELAEWYSAEMKKTQSQRGPKQNWRSNKSNAMRIAMLLKYGGAYLDLDAISLKPIIGPKSQLPLNSVGIQADENCGDGELTNGAVMVFEKGALFLHMMQSRFQQRYNGSQWGQNGPRLLTRVWREAARDKSLFSDLEGRSQQTLRHRGAEEVGGMLEDGVEDGAVKNIGAAGEDAAEESDGAGAGSAEGERKGVEGGRWQKGWRTHKLAKSGEDCDVPYTRALHIQPPSAFYSIPWRHACDFCREKDAFKFTSTKSTNFKQLIADKYVLHVWANRFRELSCLMSPAAGRCSSEYITSEGLPPMKRGVKAENLLTSIYRTQCPAVFG
jgi:hypothetical protein